MKAGVSTKLFKIHPPAGLYILDENLTLKPSESLLLKLRSELFLRRLQRWVLHSTLLSFRLVSFTACAVSHKKKINHSSWQCNHHKRKKGFSIKASQPTFFYERFKPFESYLDFKLLGTKFYILTVFENQRKSRIQHCERSKLRLHVEWTKVH